MSLKIITIPPGENSPKVQYMPLWLGDAPLERPEGAVIIEYAKKVLAEMGFGDEAIMRLLMRNEEDDAKGRIVHVKDPAFPDSGALVSCTNKPIIHDGHLRTTSQLYRFLIGNSVKETDQELPPPIERIARLNLGTRDANGKKNVPFVINDIQQFLFLMVQRIPHWIKDEDAPQHVLVYMSNYRSYGIRQWPIDMRWEVEPVNGKRPASPMCQELQFLLNMTALTLLSKIHSYNATGRVVSICPPRMYASAVFGRPVEDNDERLLALESLQRCLGHLSGRLPEENAGEMEDNKKIQALLRLELSFVKTLAMTYENDALINALVAKMDDKRPEDFCLMTILHGVGLNN